MASPQQLRALGTVFLSCGLGFLVAGIASQMTAMYGVAPAFIGMGVVFLGKSRQSRSRAGADS